MTTEGKDNHIETATLRQEIMDIDNIKAAWKSQTFNAPDSQGGTEYIRNSMHARAFSDLLRRRTRTLAFLPIVLTPAIIVCFNSLGLPDWINFLTIGTLFILALINAAVWHRASNLKIGEIDMKRALNAAISLRKLIFRSRIYGILVAIPLIAAILVQYYNLFGIHVLTGGIIGIIIGGIIGTKTYRRTMSLISWLESSLAELSDE